ncbi:hypothetical protein GE061_008814 [Apolygus lucorum]|uniref:Uncharacterized protein n=1 Tax=Apolygus lucorum TaxID=248454 RepID=A0A8S9WNM3_APOLU|nr:hypothetical protein GE061_008814 [Apolygus lucorum]
MEDGIVVEEEPMSEGDEDEVTEVKIKQEVLIGDEYVKEEVGYSWTDEDVGCPMIKQEDSSAADPLCDESDSLQGSLGVQRSEAGPARDRGANMPTWKLVILLLVMEGETSWLSHGVKVYAHSWYLRT